MSETVIVTCSHCKGTGKCECWPCQRGSDALGTGSKVPCSVCGGSGKQRI